jgi:TonB family protein
VTSVANQTVDRGPTEPDSSRLRLAVELDCDARVLRAAEDPERYGRLLLFIAQRQSQTRLAPMLAESNSHLSRRITNMNSPVPARPRARVALLTLVAAGALACSTKYANDLTTAPSLSARPLTTASQSARSGDLAGARPAVQTQNSASPRYPDILRSAGVEGEVLVAFVVDTMGLADPRTLKVLQSTHELFAIAVRNALPNMRFVPPALRDGTKVKQLVEQQFIFDVAGSNASVTHPPPVPAGWATPGPRAIWMLAPVIVTVPARPQE